MSLTLALNTAMSGLMVAQRGLDVISHNVSNANTDGYSRKLHNIQSRVLAGYGAGVETASVSRTVDVGMIKDIRREESTLGGYDVLSEYYSRLQDLFGRPEDNSSLSHTVTEFSKQLDIMATDVNKPTQQWSAVQAALDISSQMDKMTTQIQQLRLQADRDLESGALYVGEQLSLVASLNDKIVHSQAISQDTGDLEDKRDTALTNISQYMNISYFARDDGSVVVFTGAGDVMLDSTARTITHNAVSTVQSLMNKTAGTLSDITLNNGDITSSIGSGKMKSLIDMRDKILPNLQAEVDRAAYQLKTELNKIHNRGMPFSTAQPELTGTRVFQQGGKQTITYSGTEDTAVVIFDADGNQVARTTVRTLFNEQATNAPTDYTVAGVGAALQKWLQTALPGGPGLSSATAALDNTGHFAIDLGSSTHSIGFRDQESSTAGADTLDAAIGFDNNADGTVDETISGFSNFFGLNDFFVTSQERDIFESQIKTANWAATGADAGTLQIRDSWGQIGSDITIRTGDKLANIAAAINAAMPSVTTYSSRVVPAGITTEAVGAGVTTVTLPDGTVITPAAATSFTAATKRFTYTPDGGTTALDNLPVGSKVTFGASVSNNKSWVVTANNGAGILTLDAYSVPATGAGTLNFTHSDGSTLSYAVASGATLASVATAINATNTFTGGATLTATVVSDVNGERLSVTVSDDSTLNVTDSSELQFDTQASVTATVIPEGSGYRLRLQNSLGKETFLTQTVGTALVTLGVTQAASRMATDLTVRSEIIASPSKISRGMAQYNSDTGKYYLSPGDNEVALQMADMMTSKQTVIGSGDIPTGGYSIAEYSTAVISLVSRTTEHNDSQKDYQKTLTETLNFRYTSLTGVNLDEEVSQLMVYQQAYSAAAKVISTTQQMFEILNNILR
jgi:flagellar hook-associated protein 1 FlgK